MKPKEEVLFRYPFPGTLAGFGDVTLITHTKGDYSLHLQTGEYHEYCLAIATQLLSWRGLSIGKPILLGPSGMYYVVHRYGFRCNNCKTEYTSFPLPRKCTAKDCYGCTVFTSFPIGNESHNAQMESSDDD